MVAQIGVFFAVGGVGGLPAGVIFVLTPPADVDRVDGGARGGVAGHHIDYFLAVWRVGRSGFFRVVVGELGLTSPPDSDRADLGVVSIDLNVDDPLAVGRVGRAVVVPIVISELDLTSPTGFDRVDLVVGPVVARIGYPAVLAGKGSLGLL